LETERNYFIDSGAWYRFKNDDCVPSYVRRLKKPHVLIKINPQIQRFNNCVAPRKVSHTLIISHSRGTRCLQERGFDERAMASGVEEMPSLVLVSR